MRATTLLRRTIPPQQFLIFIAGGYALAKFMRWLGMDSFQPSDVDLYVQARNLAEYHAVVDTFLENCTARQIHFDVRPPRSVAYTRSGRVLLVIDVAVPSLEGAQTISLIYYPDANEFDDVTNDYDINVCRVVYDFHNREFEVSAEVEVSVLHLEAFVEPLFFVEPVPTPGEIRMATATLWRMRKYEQRGFRFLSRVQVLPAFNIIEDISD